MERRISSYASNDLPFGQALFTEYNFSKELPAEDTTFDVVVPKGGR